MTSLPTAQLVVGPRVYINFFFPFFLHLLPLSSYSYSTTTSMSTNTNACIPTLHDLTISNRKFLTSPKEGNGTIKVGKVVLLAWRLAAGPESLAFLGHSVFARIRPHFLTSPQQQSRTQDQSAVDAQLSLPTFTVRIYGDVSSLFSHYHYARDGQ